MEFFAKIASFGCVMLLTLLSSTTMPAQQECECNESCPPPGYTDCQEGWLATHNEVYNIYIQKLDRNCFIEVQFCCRNRPNASQCRHFVPLPVTAACETAITCIKIPKECVVDVAPVGTPIVDDEVRQQIYQGILNRLICDNKCQHGLPLPAQPEYEWVFSMPACLRYLKTGGQNTAFCLTACGTRYCVYAFKVKPSLNPSFAITCTFHTAVEWSSQNPPWCDSYNNQCVFENCDEQYKPNCPDWEWL